MRLLGLTEQRLLLRGVDFLDGMAGFRGVLEYSLQVELQREKHPRLGDQPHCSVYTLFYLLATMRARMC